MKASSKSATVIALSPAHRLLPDIAIAACRANACGILDLGITPNAASATAAIRALQRGAGNERHWGIRWQNTGDKPADLAMLTQLLGNIAPVPLLILAGIAGTELASIRELAKSIAREVLLEVTDLDTARAAQQAAYDGVILKGHESGGRVSDLSSFVLLQEFSGQLSIPYWIQGGIGLYSAAAAMLSGAAGIVLCDQLWLTAEGPYSSDESARSWQHLDGSETVLLTDGNTQYRFYSRSGRASLRALEVAIAKGESWTDLLQAGLAERTDGLIQAGQDVLFAAPLARRFGTVGRVVTAFRDNIASCFEQARTQKPLAADSALAAAHGTRYPIAQGPMTRVSDIPAFSKEVAGAGALPFLALAVMRGPEIRTMLKEASELLAGQSWGVGILGFMPLELRQEQLEVIREFKPPFALIAGGRPSQAREMEELGIHTYLHVPSPGLLRGFLKEGARHFVFEGSECGGHTGPRTSFILWEAAIATLAETELDDPSSVQVLFAGGIHDALSAAMVSLLAAPLVARGMKIGVLMGTAYLFTEEIVGAGAIVSEFQQQAVECRSTALLQSGVGSYTRCAKTPFCDEFEKVRRDLVLSSKSEDETLLTLETMNIGRLRIAAKGITRNTDVDADKDSRYVTLDADTQRKEGIYMLGDVARLRQTTCKVADLHATVSEGSVKLLQASKAPASTATQTRRTHTHDDIAIVGMSCLFPGSQGLREYWQNILRGVDAITEITDARWPSKEIFDPKRGLPDKTYSKWGGFLDDIQFDPQRYGIAPATLAAIEPIQMLALEVSRQALEDAGFERRPFARDRTATIFAVGGMSDLSTFYNFRTLLPIYLAKVAGLPPEIRQHIEATLNQHELPKWTEDSFPGILGNVIAGRIANRLDLGGANFTVDAACAASLAALDAGIRQLRSGDADVVLAGGADCTNGPIGFMTFAQTHALSPRGRSRPFDASADGIAISEGIAAVVLKRLSDAERDGDRIYALIKGIGSSSDGRNRSLTAPHPAGQVAALHRAYEDAGVDPTAVSLIEAHGTGTALGDKSEVTALNQAFGAGAMPLQSCAIGSVKSMIGHTKVAAGMAGLIKAALALQQRVLPPTIGVETPSTAIDFKNSPFYVNTELRPWLPGAAKRPRVCGVSAFGFGGTNFHAVLSEYSGAYRTADQRNLHPRDTEIFAFAGADRAEIERSAKHLLDGLEHAASTDLAQIAYSLYCDQHVTRRANGGQPCRLTFIAGSIDELRKKLAQVLQQLSTGGEIRNAPGMAYYESTANIGRVCFMFPGQGSQKVNMLRDLVAGTPSLHSHFAPVAQNGAEAPVSIASYIYPVPVFSDAERQQQQQALNATEIAQPALGMVGMAGFELLDAYGLRPDFVAGHSYGEYVALCAAGVITRSDLQRLSLARGRLAASAPAGAMAALEADGPGTAAVIAQHGLKVSIANFNTPSQTIIGGSVEAIDTALEVLGAAGIRARKLPVSAAFHCELMAGVSESLAAELAKVKLQAARVPVYSNTSAQPYPTGNAQVRALLAKHIAEPVRFVEEVEALYAAGARVFVECGPGLVLSGLVAGVLGQRPHTTLALDAPGRSGWVQLAHLLTQALSIGLPVDLMAWFAGRGLQNVGLNHLFAEAGKRAKPGPLVWRVNGGRAEPWYAPRRKAAQAPFPLADTTRATTSAAIPAVSATTAMPAVSASLSTSAIPAAVAAVAPVPPAAQVSQPLASAPLLPPRAPTAVAPVRPPQSPQAAPRSAISTSQYRRTVMSSADETNPHPQPILQAASPQSGSQFAQIQHGLARLLDLQCEQQFSLRHFFDFQAQLAGLSVGQSAQQGTSGMPYVSHEVSQDLPAMQTAEHQQLAAPQQAASAPVPAAPVFLPEPVAAPLPVQEAPVAGPIAPVLPKQLTGFSLPPDLFPAATSAPQAGPASANGPAAGATAPATLAQFKAELLEAVSQRTGYPTDMLDLDAHMEADLGIDSIKRIEIFSGLMSRYNLLGDRDEESVIEELSGYKTLNDIIGWYEQLSAPPGAQLAATAVAAAGGSLPKKALTPLSLHDEKVESAARAMLADPVVCYVVKARSADLATEAGAVGLPATYPVCLVGPLSPLSAALCAVLEKDGYTVRQFIPADSTRRLNENQYEVDLSGLETVQQLNRIWSETGKPIGALINLMAADDYDGPTEAQPNQARALFLLLKEFEKELKTGASGGAGRLLNITRFDGQFGLARSRALTVGNAGTLGIVKSVAREWPTVHAKCIDAAPGLEPEWLAGQILRELRSDDASVEVGFTAQGRWAVELTPSDEPLQALPEMQVDAGAVLLVTGGAYGITADMTRALAARYRPRLVLVGRSALPEPEPEASRGLTDPAELKRFLIGEARRQDPPQTPAQIERTFKVILKNRQIRANLEAMRSSGAEVEYHCLDARDSAAFGRLIDDVYQRFGRIDGVLHGAGVISDKLIGEKPVDAFDDVFNTKVLPALVLADKLQPASLKFVAFFSSVAGRFGNVGQCDYSAANEVLNKLADSLSYRWPGVHAMSINWGPWDAGMVSADLRKLYASRSILPIPPDTGLRHFMQELGRGASGTPELVISSSIKQIASLQMGKTARTT
jgi:acyl transferase domain-containing protein/NAD(P)H-dependent flavin oxidoreductase YrpB (nitropropane dioxygenase family)/short-subunit dehydrogenase